MRIIGILVVAALFLVTAALPASAHRLDEYLQATTIDVSSDHLDINFRLTPGVDVAHLILADIDRNADASLSAAEQRSYAERVVHDQALIVDAKPIGLQLASFTFPEAASIREGLGDIELRCRADLPLGPATRTLSLENRHLRSLSIYLANVLVPRVAGVRVLTQHRAIDQSTFEITYTQPTRITTPIKATATVAHVGKPALLAIALSTGVAISLAGLARRRHNRRTLKRSLG